MNTVPENISIRGRGSNPKCTHSLARSSCTDLRPIGGQQTRRKCGIASWEAPRCPRVLVVVNGAALQSFHQEFHDANFPCTKEGRTYHLGTKVREGEDHPG